MQDTDKLLQAKLKLKEILHQMGQLETEDTR